MSDSHEIERQHHTPEGGAENEGPLSLNKESLRDLDSPTESADPRGGYDVVTLFLCKDGVYVGGQLFQQQPASANCATVFRTHVLC